MGVKSLPDIIVQKMKAGRQYDIEIDRISEILQIESVENVTERVWVITIFKKPESIFRLLV